MSLPSSLPSTTSLTFTALTWNIEGWKRNKFSLKYFIDRVSPDFIFLNEVLLFQFEVNRSTDIFKGEYCHALNSDDIADPELPLIKNRSNGGTLILWKKSLDQFITVLPSKTSSFHAILFQPLNAQPSLHVSLYLPTSGKEAEFIAEITKLRTFLEEMLDSHPEYLVFIRGDSNVNMNNKARVKIFNNFMTNLNLSSVPFNHNTYHHFMGGGLFDSKIDVLLYVETKDVHEEVSDIFCSKEYPIIQSHHDVISSVFILPEKTTPAVRPINLVPVVPNIRMKTVWSAETIPAYQSLIGQSLADLRERWLVPSSRSSVALLIQLSSEILSSAASASNTTFALSESPSTRSSKTPRAIKSAQNKVQRLCRHLKTIDPTDPNYLTTALKLKGAKVSLRKKVRIITAKKITAEDQKMFSVLSAPKASTIFRRIKSMKSVSAKPISFLKVGSDIYHGEDVKKGFFTSISELKTRTGGESEFSTYTKDYKNILELCKNKNDLPCISLSTSTKILQGMKKSVNDYFSITPAHYLNAGDAGLEHFNHLLNCIIDDINNATVDELNACYALLLHKAHGKSRNLDKAYRTISTCPLLSKALDLYIRQLHEDKWKVCQAETQYQGEGSCHELAALLVTELVQHSIHTLREPAYLLFLDAKSAFDRVLPELLIRELYLAGMDGNTTILVNNRLVNRHTYLDWNKTLMGPIKDELGLEQGGSNSSEFYKIYSNENLISAQKSRQGISLGGYLGTSQVISAIGLADDTALAANKLSNLRNILFLVQNYCKKYGVTLSHDKTKLMMFANKDKAGLKTKTFNPIRIDGHVIDFVEQAEHVGVTRSTEGNMPHILNRICAHRKALHGIGAAGVAKKARVNPLVALKLQQVYGCPVLMSGVASLALSGHEVSVFDKHLKETYLRIQKLLPNTPRAVVHFLGGNLPGTAVIHSRILSLFGMVARLRGDPLNILARNVLTGAKSSSKSWFLLVRDICLMYGLPHPISVLENPPSKETFKKLCKAKIVSYWESKLRGESSLLPSLEYFHPQFMNLTKPHPIWVTAGSNPYEVSKAIQQARFLSGRYRSAKLMRHWGNNKDGFCLAPTCHNTVESLEHILVQCKAYTESKTRLYSLWLSTRNKVVFKLVLEALSSETEYLVQFLVDCSVLPSVVKATQENGHVILKELFYLTRSWCFSIHKQRMKILGRWNFQ